MFHHTFHIEKEQIIHSFSFESVHLSSRVVYNRVPPDPFIARMTTSFAKSIYVVSFFNFIHLLTIRENNQNKKTKLTNKKIQNNVILFLRNIMLLSSNGRMSHCRCDDRCSIRLGSGKERFPFSLLENYIYLLPYSNGRISHCRCEDRRSIRRGNGETKSYFSLSNEVHHTFSM